MSREVKVVSAYVLLALEYVEFIRSKDTVECNVWKSSISPLRYLKLPQGQLIRTKSLLKSDHKKYFPSSLTGQLCNKGMTLRCLFPHPQSKKEIEIIKPKLTEIVLFGNYENGEVIRIKSRKIIFLARTWVIFQSEKSMGEFWTFGDKFVFLVVFIIRAGVHLLTAFY